MNNFGSLSLSQLSKMIKQKKISPLEITLNYIDKIKRENKKLNAFVFLNEENAINSAQKATEEIASGNLKGPLHGLPVAHKDLFLTKNIKTTAGSKILENNYPTFNSTVVDKLDDEGMIMLGKLNTHEFAYGPTGEISSHGASCNPWDLERISGGSSSGSAAAVSGRLIPLASGSDTGGSIRMPAACCGVTGLKPTYGRISRHGVIPLCWTMDHIGPIAQSAFDCAMFLQACAGHDKFDKTSSKKLVPNYFENINDNLEGLKIGIPSNYFFENTQRDIVKKVEEVLDFFKSKGAILKSVKLKQIEYSASAALAIYLSEATSYHDDNIRKNPELYTESVRTFLKLGDHVLAKDYIAAQRYRTLIGEVLRKVFLDVDVLVTPGITITAPKIGTTDIEINGVNADVFSALLHNTEPFDLSGLPAIVFPCGFDKNNLPVSIQLIGKPFDESRILSIANYFQKETDWHKIVPTY